MRFLLDNEEPLLLAASENRKETVELLLNSGADILATGRGRRTVLHYAVRNGWADIVQLLAERNVDLNAKDFYGMTPLLMAADEEQKECTHILIRYGAHCSVEFGGVNTVLKFAASLGWEDTIGLLKEQGIDLNAKDSEGDTPLLWAAASARKDSVHVLIRCGADVHCSDQLGNTVLHFAAKNGWEDTIKILMELKVDLERKESSFGETPLLAAAGAEEKDCVHLLLRCGADGHCSDYHKVTVLHYAAKYGWQDTAQLLMKYKCDLNAKDCSGDTPLHWAVTNRRMEMVEPLLKWGADWNLANDTHFDSAFQLLVKGGHIAEIRQGIGCGAYVGSSGYEKLLKMDAFKNGFLRDSELCSQAIVNKFNRKDLPTLYRVAREELLPPLDQMKVEKDSWIAKEVECSVSHEIVAKGHCNVLKARAMVLSMLCVKSFLDHIEQLQVLHSSSRNAEKRLNPDREGGGSGSCKKINLG